MYLILDPRTDVDANLIDAYVSDAPPETGDYVEIDSKVAECYNALKQAHNDLTMRFFSLNKEIQRSIGPLLHQTYEEGRSDGDNPYPELVDRT